MKITTDRLLLRSWFPEDVSEVRAALDVSDAHLRPWVPFMRREPQDVEGTRSWIAWRIEQFQQGEHLCFAIRRREDDALLGEAMLMAAKEDGSRSVGYWLDLRHVGRGYARESVRALTTMAFLHLGVPELDMSCAVANRASWTIPRDLGFTLVRTEPGHFVNALGETQDTQIWSCRRFRPAQQDIHPLRVMADDGTELLRR